MTSWSYLIVDMISQSYMIPDMNTCHLHTIAVNAIRFWPNINDMLPHALAPHDKPHMTYTRRYLWEWGKHILSELSHK